jgi:hypothetical protein
VHDPAELEAQLARPAQELALLEQGGVLAAREPGLA